MGIIIDIIVIGIIILSTFLAYKKGLVKLAVHLCSFIIAIVLTIILYQPIANLVINGTQIDESIENTIYEKANEIIKDNGENEITTDIIETAKNEMLPETAKNLSINIVKGGVGIILFLAIRIGLIFVTALADFIAKLPILEQINKAGGVIYGILRGAVIIYVVLLIISVSEQISPENIVSKNINESYITKAMYQNNILKVLF